MRDDSSKAAENSCVITAENAITMHFVGFFTSANEALRYECEDLRKLFLWWWKYNEIFFAMGLLDVPLYNLE